MFSFRSAIQGIFVFFTVLFGIFFRKADVLLNIQQMQMITKILTPAYLVIAGLMIGMFLHNLFSHVTYHHIETMTYHDRMVMEKDINSGLFLGLMIGTLLAFLYIAKIS